MPANIVQKILEKHIVEGSPIAGKEIGIKIDQTLTQDATGTMAYLQFEAMGLKAVKTEISVSYVDHNTIQEGFENADDHAYLESVAAKYGIFYSRPGNGICHQVHLERFGIPGKTLLGSDSHTPTCGGIGMISIGAGGLDVAVAMGGGLFYLTYPQVIKVNLTGKLKPWVAAKDIILKLLEILSTKGNVGKIIEYSGPGVSTLSVPQRATITNMGAELGVTTSVFPSDEITKAFMDAQNRGESFVPLKADDNAAYDSEIEINLSELVPMAACPHSPGNVKKVSELSEIKVNQVCIGSCTNGSLRDMMVVAGALKGKKISPEVSLGVACGSRQVLEMISRNGALADIVASGARILETACGFCIGNSMAPKTDGVSIRTSNRNFFGRSGTPSAQVYLVSPETAVAAALSGKLTDPTSYFIDKPYNTSTSSEHFTTDDSLISKPLKNNNLVEIVRGPNIGEPPSNVQCGNNIKGIALLVAGDKVTTDDIMPAGSRLKYRSNIPKYAEFVFERTDPMFAKTALENKSKGIANIIVAGESYGQGSSREHAAICPMFLGVKLVIAKSIERIHKANLINFGIIPAIFENSSDYDLIKPNDKLELANIKIDISEGLEILKVKNVSSGKIIPVRITLSDREKKNILAGGLINAINTI